MSDEHKDDFETPMIQINNRINRTSIILFLTHNHRFNQLLLLIYLVRALPTFDDNNYANVVATPMVLAVEIMILVVSE